VEIVEGKQHLDLRLFAQGQQCGVRRLRRKVEVDRSRAREGESQKAEDQQEQAEAGARKEYSWKLDIS
jgi:hypothetical protein